MGKKGKKAQVGKPKKLTPKDVGKRLDVLVRKLGEELEGADLFKPLPPAEDCPVCFVPLPRNVNSETYYEACCGKAICYACCMENEESINKHNEENPGKKRALTCPFCREPEPPARRGFYRQVEARCLQNDHIALGMLGENYLEGDSDTAKDVLKALDCWIRAVELGSAGACVGIGRCYEEGNEIAVDMERVALFERVGALRGDVTARNNIGWSEYDNFGNHAIAIRHWKIAAEAGYQDSLDALRTIYNADGKNPGKEFISKEHLDFAYRACHGAQVEVRSEGRKKHVCVKG